MAQPLILIIDDDYKLAQGLRAGLLNEGYEVMTAVNGVEGIKAARRHSPNLIILDINMPWMNGLEVCNHLRQDTDFSKVPILFLTSRNTIDERIAGLDEGADDYLGKPFNLKELKAHVRALLRRYPPTTTNDNNLETIELGSITLNLKACWVRVNGGETIQLTPVEFELLHYLMRHPQQPFSSEELLEKVWAYEPGTADTSLARWHIKNLRTKIEPNPSRPVYLRTVPRHGYLFDSLVSATEA